MTVLVLRRVPYGKETTPKEEREYQIYPGSPVGNRSDWMEFARKRGNVSKIILLDQEQKEELCLKP